MTLLFFLFDDWCFNVDIEGNKKNAFSQFYFFFTLAISSVGGARKPNDIKKVALLES
jgi:hypothetical protein